MKDIYYVSVVGSLMYGQICSHLDIAYAVSVLQRFQCIPGIIYGRTSQMYWDIFNTLKILWWLCNNNADFSVTRFLDVMKSTSGYMFTLGSGAITWKSVIWNLSDVMSHNSSRLVGEHFLDSGSQIELWSNKDIPWKFLSSVLFNHIKRSSGSEFIKMKYLVVSYKCKDGLIVVGILFLLQP